MAADLKLAELSPDQRRRELSAILARGVLRLKQRRATRGEPAAQTLSEKPLETGHDHLEVPGETVLSVHTG